MLKYYKNIFLLLLKSNATPPNESNNGKNDVLGEISGDKEIVLGLNEIEKVFDGKIDKATREKFLKKWLGNDLGKVDEENSGLADKLVTELVNKLDKAKTDKELIKTSVKKLLSGLKNELSEITSKDELDKLAGDKENILQADGNIIKKEKEIVVPGDKLPPKKEKEASIVNNEFNTPSEFLEKVKGSLDHNIKSAREERIRKNLSQLEKSIDKYNVVDYPILIKGLELIVEKIPMGETKELSPLMKVTDETVSFQASRLIKKLEEKIYTEKITPDIATNYNMTIKDKKGEIEDKINAVATPKAQAIPTESLENLINKIKESELFTKVQDISKQVKEKSTDNKPDTELTDNKNSKKVIEKAIDTKIPQLKDNKKIKPLPENSIESSTDSKNEAPIITPFNKQIEKILKDSNIDLNNFTKENAVSILDEYKETPYSKEFWKKDEAYPLTIAIQYALGVEPIDGKFGPKTKKAVIDFQKEKDLQGYKNGATGPITINALLKKLNSN